jgi:chemotaxis protein histidine kinase CheA
LTVARGGQVVTVQVADDGRGLNLADIRAKAIERGLLEADATPSDAEIARLTLLPGFSTRDAVTEISGRGVGLDVVATRLRALSGSIDIRSVAGSGLTIELRFQASLVATHALFVRDGMVFTLPARRAAPFLRVQPRAARDGTDDDGIQHELGVLNAAPDHPERKPVCRKRDRPIGLLECGARRQRTGDAPWANI